MFLKPPLETLVATLLTGALETLIATLLTGVTLLAGALDT